MDTPLLYANGPRAEAEQAVLRHVAADDMYVDRSNPDEWTIWYFAGRSDAERSWNLVYGVAASWCAYYEAVNAEYEHADEWGEGVWQSANYVHWHCYNPELLVHFLERLNILPAEIDGRVPKLPIPGNPNPYLYQIAVRHAINNDIHTLPEMR